LIDEVGLKTHLLEFCLDVAPNLVLSVAVVFLLRRGLRKLFPFFFYYIVFQLVCFVLALIAYLYILSDPHRLSRLYQWVVTSELLIQSCFEVGVLYELSEHVLLSSITRWHGLRSFLRWGAAILVLTGSVTSSLVMRGNLTRVLETFQTLNFGINLIKVGFLIMLILLTRVLDISWKGLSSGIALGFGIAALTDVAASALMSDFTKLQNGTVDILRMGAFLICTLVWLGYIVHCEKPRNLQPMPLANVEGRLRELQRMLGQ
jgi:hypothetical protein